MQELTIFECTEDLNQNEAVLLLALRQILSTASINRHEQFFNDACNWTDCAEESEAFAGRLFWAQAWDTMRQNVYRRYGSRNAEIIMRVFNGQSNFEDINFLCDGDKILLDLLVEHIRPKTSYYR